MKRMFCCLLTSDALSVEESTRINQDKQVCWELTVRIQAVWTLPKIIGIGEGQTRVYEDEEVLTMTREVNEEKLLERIDEENKMLI